MRLDWAQRLGDKDRSPKASSGHSSTAYFLPLRSGQLGKRWILCAVIICLYEYRYTRQLQLMDAAPAPDAGHKLKTFH